MVDILKSTDRLLVSDIGNILLNIINRRRFEYRVSDIIEYLLKCVWCRRDIKRNIKYNKHYLYEKCVTKMQHELDLVTMLKQGRQT